MNRFALPTDWNHMTCRKSPVRHNVHRPSDSETVRRGFAGPASTLILLRLGSATAKLLSTLVLGNLWSSASNSGCQRHRARRRANSSRRSRHRELKYFGWALEFSPSIFALKREGKEVMALRWSEAKEAKALAITAENNNKRRAYDAQLLPLLNSVEIFK